MASNWLACAAPCSSEGLWLFLCSSRAPTSLSMLLRTVCVTGCITHIPHSVPTHPTLSLTHFRSQLDCHSSGRPTLSLPPDQATPFILHRLILSLSFPFLGSVYTCVPARMCVHHMHTGTQGGQKQGLSLSKLQVFTGCFMWVLGTEPGFTRAVCSLKLRSHLSGPLTVYY